VITYFKLQLKCVDYLTP